MLNNYKLKIAVSENDTKKLFFYLSIYFIVCLRYTIIIFFMFQVFHDQTQDLLENLMTTEEYVKPDHVIQNKISQVDDVSYEKAKKLLHYDDAPEYLKHNNYIVKGYRGTLDTKLCMER